MVFVFFGYGSLGKRFIFFEFRFSFVLNVYRWMLRIRLIDMYDVFGMIFSNDVDYYTVFFECIYFEGFRGGDVIVLVFTTYSVMWRIYLCCLKRLVVKRICSLGDCSFFCSIFVMSFICLVRFVCGEYLAFSCLGRFTVS